MKFSTGAATGSAMLALLTGCVGTQANGLNTAPETSAASSTPSPTPGLLDTSMPPGAQVTTVATHTDFGDNVSSLDPPTSGQVPGIDAAAAWKAYVTSGLMPTCDGPHLSIAFGRYTNKQTAHVSADGSRILDYVDVPEWVIRCKDVQMVFSQAPDPHATASATPAQPVLVDAVEVVDANTGRLLLGFNNNPS